MTPKGSGTVNVTITNVLSQSSALNAAFAYIPAPTISAITPAIGPSLGGTPITITGANFQPGATVSLGGATATGVTVINPTQITATTGPRAAATVAVSVTNPDGQTGLKGSIFTYAASPAPSVTSVSPVSGPTAGGTTVTITGGNFAPGATVNYDSGSATNVTVVSGTTITAVTPAHASGAVPVKVTNPDKQSGSLAAAFKFLSPPAITNLSVTTGSLSGGTAVTISGSAFQTGAVVTFGGLSATVTSTTPTAIKVITPASSLGSVNVVVTNTDGQQATITGAFTYVPATPTGLGATAGFEQISLSWTSAAGASIYNVLRSPTSGGTYAPIGTTSTTTYIDTGLGDGVRWYYVVEATGSGTSGNSNIASATTIPPFPTGLTATPGTKRVALSWGAAAGATGYTLLRGTKTGGPYTSIASPTGTTYTNTGLTTGTTYYYVVESRNAAGASANSPEVSATPQ